MKQAMKYRSKKSNRYRNKPYTRQRRYLPYLGRGGGYTAPYARPNLRYESNPSSAPEKYPRTQSADHYVQSRDSNPEVQQIIFELNQLKNQKAIEQGERGNLLPEMLAESTPQQKEFDTVERAENLFKKSREDEQTRLESFTEWVDRVSQHNRPEPLYDEPFETIQTKPRIETNKVEQNQTLELTIADLELLTTELYANPLESKKEAESLEQAESHY